MIAAAALAKSPLVLIAFLSWPLSAFSGSCLVLAIDDHMRAEHRQAPECAGASANSANARIASSWPSGTRMDRTQAGRGDRHWSRSKALYGASYPADLVPHSARHSGRSASRSINRIVVLGSRGRHEAFLSSCQHRSSDTPLAVGIVCGASVMLSLQLLVEGGCGAMRLQGKAGIVVGAGQSPGETVGTGRAAAIVFAREGANVLLVDRDLDSARETANIIAERGGVAECFEGDWTVASDCQAFAQACVDKWGRIDFLQNNVGISTGDGTPLTVTEEVFDRIIGVNLKGCLLSCQAVVPTMREQRSGSIVNISSVAVFASAMVTAYKMSKSGMNALTQALAIDNAAYGVRASAIMPGIIDTPMAVDKRAAIRNVPRAQVKAERDATVPLRGKMGTGWDIAHASLFLHSDEASYITGVVLPVDGGFLTRIGG